MNNHPFHLVEKSPWPITSSMGVMTLASGIINLIYNSNYFLMLMGTMITLLSMTQWWRDVIRESTFQGLHSNNVIKNMKMGMILFIISEVMLFSSFFWAFFHSSLSPSIEIGMNWPPMNIKSFNPLSVPLLNTMILLSSGISLTWAHSSLLTNNYSQSIKSMLITIILGIYFSIIQTYEYIQATFSISDSIFGASFFMTTGLHGLHVIVGTTFILISMKRLMSLHYSKKHHVGFECSAWYWHFVDVVWLLLYVTMYWWGS
uniref:Cytochrome c oxidase subunit 3 n=1 Tax=Hemicentrus obliquus TaxID=3065208 RepID=A0AA95NLI7_9HEMI|nr:cytochrome c oxidase subunit III [Hemicentrus obliquus]WKZ08037.1 cytochrome c oxidase subunit III [Hemicentrus obliquus]